MMKKRKLFVGIILWLLGVFGPGFFPNLWVDMIVDIRTAIVSGDSGHLILTAFIWAFLGTVQCLFVINGLLIVVKTLLPNILKVTWVFLFIHMVFYILSLIIINQYTPYDGEVVSSLVAGFFTFYMLYYLIHTRFSFWRNLITSGQLLFGFFFLNTMPAVAGYGFGLTDIPASMKVAAEYLDSVSVLDFIGLVFFITLFLSSVMTTRVFITYDRNIAMAKTNYENEMTLDSMRRKAVQTRAYEEIHAITHDLKTPLVTIRGLNSLISLSQDEKKVLEYTERIDDAVTKMSEMITGFLYESNKQVIEAGQIIDHVRMQIPVEDESIHITFHLQDQLPSVYVNKVRVSRALINILENAFTAPTNATIKVVRVEVKADDDWLYIRIEDNGVGISEEIMERIWESGYSTKNTTGFGLAFVKQVMENNKGTIRIDSSVGSGTKVSLVLPVYKEGMEEEEIHES